MKILPNNRIIQSQNIHKKVTNLASDIRNDIKSGISYANRLSRQKNHGKIKTFRTKCIGINRKLPDDFWYAIAGTCTPVPGGTFIGIALGRIIKNLKIKK